MIRWPRSLAEVMLAAAGCGMLFGGIMGFLLTAHPAAPPPYKPPAELVRKVERVRVRLAPVLPDLPAIVILPKIVSVAGLDPGSPRRIILDPYQLGGLPDDAVAFLIGHEGGHAALGRLDMITTTQCLCDAYGISAMSRAGYNPQRALDLAEKRDWERTETPERMACIRNLVKWFLHRKPWQKAGER